MRKENVALMIQLALISIATAGQRESAPQTGLAFSTTFVTIGAPNLPFQPIGVSDLIRLTVSDCPELSRSFRVDPQSNPNLPLLRAPISAMGMIPSTLGDESAAALRAEHLLANPIVVVPAVEYTGRGVTVSGAVKAPITIQDLGNLRVLGALIETDVLLPEARPEIIVELPDGTTVRKLFDRLHPELNIPVGWVPRSPCRNVNGCLS
jgi:protein involved in polysaccharide export with SLBB domain